MNTVMPSHPFVEIFSSQEVAAAAGVFLLAVIGLATMGVRWARTWVETQIGALHSQVAEVGDRAKGAREAAEQAVDATTNSHGTHIRDDLDEVRDAVDTILKRMDAAELARIEARDTRERRDRRAEDQIDGMRDDIRSLTASAERVHARLDERVTALEAAR